MIGASPTSNSPNTRSAAAAIAEVNLIVTAPTPRSVLTDRDREPEALSRTGEADRGSLCAFARFCDPNGQVWRLVEETDHAKAKQDFVRQTCDCPSGRLVAWDNETGKPIEPKLEPSLGLIEDKVEQCSGPIWARGGIQVIAADGFHYEIRNRVTLCRCGASKNKPFCDGTHAAIKFRDES